MRTIITTQLRFVVVAALLSCGASACANSDPKAAPPSSETTLLVLDGIRPDGRPTREWLAAIQSRHSRDALDTISISARPITDAQSAWRKLVFSRLATWSEWTDSLSTPFGPVDIPDTVHVLIGNSGGEDAFTPTTSKIAFDLGRLTQIYGAAADGENVDRIDRFYAHELTHIVHKAWVEENPVPLKTPLDLALWDCLVEGIGNYRSLSAKWVNRNGKLTAHARQTLGELELVFVERILALASASENDVDELMQGLSSGPFSQKWGALTTALWLAQEAGGDQRRLRAWVDAGPKGVLELARRYLPEELARKLADI